MLEVETTWGGWGEDIQNDPYPHFAEIRGRCPVHAVRLGDGHDAYLVVGHDAARQALARPTAVQGHARGDGRRPRRGRRGPARTGVRPAHARRGPAGPHPPARHGGQGVRAVAHRCAGASPGAHRRGAARRPGAVRPGRRPRVRLRPAVPVPRDRRAARRARGRPAGAARRVPHGCSSRGAARRRPTPSPRRTSSSATSSTSSTSTGACPPTTSSASSSRPATSLTRQELLSSLFQLIVAGHDTTTSLIGNGIVALLDHPDQLRLLRAEPQRIPEAVEEIIRFDAPVPHATFRVTTEAVELGGVEVPAGQQVLVCIGGANHDPARPRRPGALRHRAGRPSRISASVTASTSASAPRSPAWRAASPSVRCCAASRTSRSPFPATSCSGATATASSCAAWPSCPSA